MICPNCNKENNPGVSFCVNCGTKLSPTPQQAPNTPPANPYEYKDPSVANTTQYNPTPTPTSQQFAPDQFSTQNYNQYNQANNYAQPQTNNGIEDDDQVNRKAKKFAIIALCLYFGRNLLTIAGAFLSGILSYLSTYDSSNSSYSFYSGTTSLLGLLCEGLSMGCFIASLVLIIMAKVKVSQRKLKNTFVNVSFWVIIGCIIASVVLTIIAFVLLFAACGAMITACD